MLAIRWYIPEYPIHVFLFSFFLLLQADPYPDIRDPANRHGTNCAGVAAAVANNSLCGVRMIRFILTIPQNNPKNTNKQTQHNTIRIRENFWESIFVG